jgi:hypothetical protein
MNELGQVKPAYEVVPLGPDFVTERTVFMYSKNKDGMKTREEKRVKDTGGYLIKTMKNGSFRVRSLNELRRMNLDQMPALVHVESGEEVPLHVGRVGIADQIEKLEESA